MDNLKTKILLILLFSILVISIQSISATEINDANDDIIDLSNEIETVDVKNANPDAVSDNPFADESVNIEDPNSKNSLSAEEPGNFTELNQTLYAHDGGTIELQKDYIRLPGEKGIAFWTHTYPRVPITIIGNGHTIKGMGPTFDLDFQAPVIFKNITFENCSVVLDQLSTNSIIENCTFTKCEHTQVPTLRTRTVTIDNCRFIDNIRGVDIYQGSTYDSHCNITNCVFENTGQAISYDMTHNLTIFNCNFTSNHGWRGGAIGCAYMGDNLTVSYCNFISNYATDEGGAIYAGTGRGDTVEYCNFTNNNATNGGALIYVDNIRNCNFTNNNATKGGAVHNCGNIENCVFTNNTAINGSAVYAFSTNISNCNFTSNRGIDYRIDEYYDEELDEYFSIYPPIEITSRGGAIYYEDNNGTVNNCNFLDNTASYGGAIYTKYNYRRHTDIENSTFSGNNATNGSAIYNNGTLYVNNITLLDNQAKASSLGLKANVDGHNVSFTTVFKGNDNILNGIYNFASYRYSYLKNVKYYGVGGEVLTISPSDYSLPVSSADESEDGELAYQDLREAGIDIIISIYDEDGNFLFNVTNKTDIFGNNNAQKLGLNPGTYKAIATHLEDTYYTEIQSDEITFTIETPLDVIVTLDEVTNYTGAVVEIVVLFKDEYGNDVQNGTATLTIDYGNKLSNLLMASADIQTAKVSEGKATFVVTLGDPGVYPSKAEYTPLENDNYYNPAEAQSHVNVLKLDTTTESDDVSGTSGDTVDITADITDNNENPVKNGTAVLTINGKEYTAEVTGGKATFTNVELPSESTTATINYLGNDYYNPSNTTIDITINEEPTDEPTTEPEQNPTLEPKPVTTKTVTSIKGPVAGNPIAMLLLVMMALVSTISIRRQK